MTMKMTLIDKDKFIQDVISRKYSQASMRLIREQPEVKAIPVEYIERKLAEHWYVDYDIRELLDDWEKENETN